MPTVLITGANRGLGLEFARQYADEGWMVHACARDPRSARELNDVARRFEGRVSVHALDVRDHGAINALAAKLASEPIDVLINNAGIFGDHFGSTLDMVNYEKWIETFNVNVMGPHKITQAFLPAVENGNLKRLIYITSMMGSIADNTSGGSYIYRSSKAALNMVVKTISLELKSRGITAVAIHPGWVRTDMGGERAPMLPEESVRIMRRTIAALTPSQTGKFLNNDGTEIAW